jgi:hypothetical protein
MQFIHRWNSNLTQSRWCNKRWNQRDADLLQLFFWLRYKHTVYVLWFKSPYKSTIQPGSRQLFYYNNGATQKFVLQSKSPKKWLFLSGSLQIFCHIKFKETDFVSCWKSPDKSTVQPGSRQLFCHISATTQSSYRDRSHPKNDYFCLWYFSVISYFRCENPAFTPWSKSQAK